MNHTKISRFISTTTVTPASINHDDNHTQRIIELTSSDLRFLKIHYIQKGLLFHKSPVSTNLLVQRLKATLSQALSVFYPLAGRLAMIKNDDKTASFHVDCNGDGALFVHAVIDGVTVADILDPAIVPNDIVHSFFPMNGVSNYEAAVSKLPLLAVQVTEFVDGYFIACSMNHVVADGTSFWHFFNVWSEISRGGLGYNDDVVLQNPHSVSFGREYLDGIIDLPIRVPFPHNIDHHDQTSSSVDDHHRLQQRMIHFSKEKVAELKAKANAEMGFTNNEISSLQALLAHFWISVTRGRDLKPNEDVHYLVAVGLRSRLEPPLPKGYLGNAVRAVIVKSTVEELLGRGLGWAAAQIREMITSVTSTDARKYWEDWVKSPTFTDFEKLLPPNSLLTGSSPRFNVYGNDFGWGRPVAVRCGPANKFDGKLTPFPGAEEGSIDFEVCLSRKTLEAMAG